MYNEQELWQLAESSLNGGLNASQQEDLQIRLQQDAAFAAVYYEHLHMLQGLNDKGRQHRFRSMLVDIAAQQNAPKVTAKKKKIIYFQPRYLKLAGVAAGVALLTSITTVWSLKRNADTRKYVTNGIQYLERKIEGVKQNQNVQQRQIDTLKGQLQEGAIGAPGNFGGTGFALTNDGYLVTNFHVAEGADSIYIQTKNGRYYKAQTVAFEPKSDVAILKIVNSGFRFGKGDLPYQFATNKAALGSRIFTLGFPQDAIVYSEGYIAAKNGYEGDSLQYRLELPSELGQSGAPVMDALGRIVGIITSNDQQSSSKTYAVSTAALLRLMKDLPKSSNIKLPANNTLGKLSREEQVSRLEDYTCMVRVFKK